MCVRGKKTEFLRITDKSKYVLMILTHLIFEEKMKREKNGSFSVSRIFLLPLVIADTMEHIPIDRYV